jgi:hypothetical protein
MGSKPNLRTATVAATRAAGSSPGKNVTDSGVSAGIKGAASCNAAMSFAVISNE